MISSRISPSGATRSTAALEHWKSNVDERLESLSSEAKARGKTVEASHSLQLKERLAEIGEQYRAQTAKLEEQITAVESELRSRITASDHSILTFVEQFRAEFAQARETAANIPKTNSTRILFQSGNPCASKSVRSKARRKNSSRRLMPPRLKPKRH